MKYLRKVFLSFLLLTPFAIAKVWGVPGDCPTIQAALDSCSTGDTVLVSEGIYFENLIWPSTNGIKLISANEIENYEATIYADIYSGSAIRIETGVDTSTIIRGFKIQNGSSGLSDIGGGICCVNSSPTIDNNFITENGGGGIGCKGSSSPIIKNNVIDGNDASFGAGISCDTSSSPQIINNIIKNNQAVPFPGGDGCGGGIAILCNSQIIINGNTIANNISYSVTDNGFGAGIYCENTSPLIINNEIIGNNGYIGFYTYGGGIFCKNSSPMIIRNIIVNNSSLSGAIHCNYYSSPIIDSCIIINNNSDGVYSDFGSNPEIYYNDIYNNTGFGVMNMDSTVLVIAGSNWWGDNSGPYHPILNLNGLGDEVSDNVDFEPWLIKVVNEIEDGIIQASDYSLYQNYPNPFNPNTKIKYSMPKLSYVAIKVFDILGNEIETLVNEEKPNGIYEVDFNAKNLPSGVYFYRLQAGDFIETKKMVLLR